VENSLAMLGKRRKHYAQPRARTRSRELSPGLHTVGIAYGKTRLPLELDPALADWHVIQPRQEAPMPDPHDAFLQVCRNPSDCLPLREVIQPSDRVVIVTSDGTRPVPNQVLLPWLLEELPIPPEQLTVLVGTGTHRPNTPDEIRAMFGLEVARRVRIVNHDAFSPEQNEDLGQTASEMRVLLDKVYTRADKRIVLGFVEPHFFAGFSGGAKGVVPGVAGIETIFDIHGFELLAHPRSTWGALDDNPVHQTILDAVALCPPEFLVNVTLNRDKAITGLFAGDYRTAHRAACTKVREAAMVPVPQEFPIVVTSNSGFPLDQNLYQSVKGMSAAARIVQPGGTIVMASECGDGIPAHGNFGTVLRENADIEGVEAWLRGLASPVLDQWQIQLLAQILKRAKVALHSRLSREVVESCNLVHLKDFQKGVRDHIERLGKRPPIAVLPDGPLTLPYVQCGRVRSRYPAGANPAPVRLASRRVASPWREGSNP